MSERARGRWGVVLAAGLAAFGGVVGPAHGQPAPGGGVDAAALARDLESQDPAVRQKAALALGKLGPAGKAAVPALIEIVNDPKANGQTRREAVEALGGIGPDARPAVGALVERLDQPDPDNMYVAPFTEFGAEAGPQDSDNDEEAGGLVVPLRSLVIVALGRIGPAAAPDLLRALDHPRVYRRQGIGQALGRMPPPEVGPQLLDALAGPNPRVRDGAALALGKLGPAAAPAVPALTRALSDPNLLVRVRAAKALWKIDGQTDAPCKVLGETLKLVGPSFADELLKPEGSEDAASHRVAEETVRLMGKAGIPARIEQLASPSTGRMAAIVALGEFGPDAKAAVPALVDILRTRAAFFPEAVGALARIGPDAREAVPDVVAAATDPAMHPDNRKDFARAVVAIDGWGWSAAKVYFSIYRTGILLGAAALAVLIGVAVWLRRRARAQHPPDPIHW